MAPSEGSLVLVILTAGLPIAYGFTDGVDLRHRLGFVRCCDRSYVLIRIQVVTALSMGGLPCLIHPSLISLHFYFIFPTNIIL